MSAAAEAVVTEELTKLYRDVEAVAGLNLTVPAGEIFGFLGPNGAGNPVTKLRRSLSLGRGRWVGRR